MLSEANFYLQQALRCEERLSRVSDPRGRQFIEQERRDWAELAELAATQPRAAQPQRIPNYVS